VLGQCSRLFLFSKKGLPFFPISIGVWAQRGGNKFLIIHQGQPFFLFLAGKARGLGIQIFFQPRATFFQGPKARTTRGHTFFFQFFSTIQHSRPGPIGQGNSPLQITHSFSFHFWAHFNFPTTFQGHFSRQGHFFGRHTRVGGHFNPPTSLWGPQARQGFVGGAKPQGIFSKGKGDFF